MAFLYFKYGSMNSGKTTQLLQLKFNYAERNMNCLLLKPEIDTRDGVNTVSSRIGLKSPALAIKSDEKVSSILNTMMLDGVTNYDIIIIDEAQFLSREQVIDLAMIVDELKISVFAYGLKTDFKGELFEGSNALLCFADKFEEIKCTCFCGKKAHMNARIVNGNISKSGNQIEIGGNEKYISLCRYHYFNYDEIKNQK